MATAVLLQEGTPVPVSFAPDFASTNQEVVDLSSPKPESQWLLLELPKEQLEELQNQQTFSLKEVAGSKGGAVLCSSGATFNMEFLENSNSLLIGSLHQPADSTKPQCEVIGQCRGQIILKPGTGDLQRVQELLMPHALGSPEESPGLSIEELEYQVAASRKELQAMLASGAYVDLQGRWLYLPPAVERSILDVALTTVTAMGWDMAAVESKALLQEVQQHFGESASNVVPAASVLLKALRGVLAEQGNEALDERLALDSEKVRSFRALQLLQEAPEQLRRRLELPKPAPRPKRPRLGPGVGLRDGQALRLEEFLTAFQETTGSETTTEEVLKILGPAAYIDELEATIHPIEVATLPQNPVERLKRLFELLSHWNPECLSSFMASSMGTGQKVEPWLMKYARAVYVEVDGTEKRMLVKKFAGL